MIAPLARTLLRHCTWLAYTAVALAMFFVLVGALLHDAGELDRSMWEGADTAATRVIPFMVGVIATPVLLPALVAHGVTRRRFATAVGTAGGLLATAVGLYLAAGYAVERVIYGAIDLPQRVDSAHLYESAGQPFLVVVEVALLAMAYLLAGWLVGTGGYGYGRRGGGVLLPAALVVAAVEYALGTGWVASAIEWLDLPRPELPLPVAVALAVAVLALGMAAGRALVHPVPVRARRLP